MIAVTGLERAMRGLSAIQRAPMHMTRIMNGDVLPRYRERIHDRFVEYPDPPNYPPGEFPWVSDAQRKAAMAAIREKGGPPYPRSNEFGDAWEISSAWAGVGGSISAKNDVGYANVVVGEKQQPFHEDRWYDASEEIEEIGQDFGRDVARAYTRALAAAQFEQIRRANP